ncbi:hypothetical protein ACLOJK_011226 [Asimina triloba]
MAAESSAVQMNSVEEGNLEDLPFDWLAELLDHIDGETDEAKAGMKDVVKDETKDEAKESIDVVVGNKASCSSPALQKQDCIPSDSERGKPVSGDDSDDDCLILDADPDKPVAIENDKMNGSDDLVVVSVKGPVRLLLLSILLFLDPPDVKQRQAPLQGEVLMGRSVPQHD